MTIEDSKHDILKFQIKVKLKYLNMTVLQHSRRSTGSGGESSSMLTSVEGNAVQAFSGFYN
jgi:hypothetical protein